MIAFKSYTRFPFIFSGSVVKSFINIHRLLNVGACKQFAVYKTSIYNERQSICASFFLPYRYMAGHAKWQNVKHVKAERDRQKATLCNKYVRLLTQAVREKGPDPKVNIKLVSIMESARKENVPNATLEAVLKRASSNKKLQYGTIEMLGPGGIIVVLEYETDNICEIRRAVKVICRKYSAGIFPGDGGRWRAVYEQKGIIKVTGQLNGEAFDGEKMLDAAIEAGAEDVQKGEEENKILYEFFCAPDDLNLVKKELEQKFVVEEAYVGYIPMSTVALSDEDKTIALNFLNELGELPDVSRMFENLE